MFKSYPKQYGPNLTLYDVRYGAHDPVTHGNGCGGTLVQEIRDYGVDRDAPGKIFCFTCGIKVGRKLVAAMKRGVDEDLLNFPNREKFELMDRVFAEMGEDEKNHIFRYWEFQEKEEDEITGLVSDLLKKAKSKLRKKKKRKVVPIGPKVEMGQTDTEWTIDHPRVSLKLSKEEFTAIHASAVVNAFREPANWEANADTLSEIALHALGAGPAPGTAAAVLNRSGKFVILDPTAYVVLDNTVWNYGEALNFRNALHAFPNRDELTLNDVRLAGVGFAEDMGRPHGSVRVVIGAVAAEEVTFPKVYPNPN